MDKGNNILFVSFCTMMKQMIVIINYSDLKDYALS